MYLSSSGILTWKSLATITGCLAITSFTVGCGAASSPDKSTATSADAAKPETKTVPTLDLSVSKPDDGDEITVDEVQVKGTVTRGARVKVAGHRAQVRGHRFTAKVRIHGRGDHEFTVRANKSGWNATQVAFSVTRVLSSAERAAIAARRRLRAQQAEANFKAGAVTIPYNQLHKDAGSYRGKKVVYRGQILQIQQEGDFGGIMLLSVTDEGYGLWDDNIWVDYDHGIQSAEDDIITVYGVVRGSKSYETQIGGETYVPRVKASYIDESG